MKNPYLTHLLQYLMSTGPMLLVTVVGLLLIIINWQRLGRAALPAAGGFALHLFASVAYLAASTILIGMVSSGSDGTSIGTKFQILGVVNGFLHAGALVLLLVALLTPRTPAP